MEKNKKVTIVLVSVIIVMLIAIGICVGLWFAGDTTKIINNKEEVVKNEENKTMENLDEEKNEIVNANKMKYEKEEFSFYGSSKWEYKIEEKNDATYKVNSNDQYYEISGKVNGNYIKAFSIMITNNQNSYIDSSWEYYGLYNGGKHFFIMRNFICRDNDGNTYTSEHYEFEKDVIEAISSINVKYKDSDEEKNEIVNENKTKYEKEDFSFQGSSKWEYKIEEKNDETYKINSNDQYYEISGKVNGNYVKAFSIVITNNQNSYMNSSWEYYGLYNGGKHIFVMRNFVCRDNDGNTYTSEHYEFEKDVIEAISAINVKYQVLNEWGSADKTTVLVGKYFLKGEPGTSKRSYIYYISENNLYRTSLKDEFPTVLLANYAKYMYYSEGDNKIHVHPVGDSFMNNIAMEDNFVVYENIN